MIARQQVQQRGRLGIEGRVGILAERRGLGAGEGGFEQPVITDRDLRAEDAPCTTTIYRPVAASFQGRVSGVGHGETWNIRFSFPLTTRTGGSAG